MIPWQRIFDDNGKIDPSGGVEARSLAELRQFLDFAHVRHCLVKPYQDNPGYPVVEPRELLPSFETDMLEYGHLPGFAMVAFSRPLDSFSEIFQYDKLHQVEVTADGGSCPLENMICERNLLSMAERLPRHLQPRLRRAAEDRDVTLLENYTRLLPFLLEMDRAHVMSLDNDGLFHLSGIFASFPSDIDSELKRFGLRIGKFAHGDSLRYERNRMFVYQYFMELYGFPIVSERRTSSALFARKLHRIGENFLLRVMGQSDRVLTTYMSEGDSRGYPRLDKLALVAIDEAQKDAVEAIYRHGYFLDEERKVVIMRVTYRQHRFNSANVRQDRALSVIRQEVLHPLTGKPLVGVNIIKDATNIFLRLNDIVRGEYMGRIIYKRSEIVENTDTDEKRLKFLYNWLIKHQRRMISYHNEFYGRISKVLFSYLRSPDKIEAFDALRGLYQEVMERISYIQQARRVRVLEELSQRKCDGHHISYRQMTAEVIGLLNELQYELVNFFPELVDTVIKCVDMILHDSYMQRKYILPPESALTQGAREVRKNYGRIVSLLDAIKAVRKARQKDKAPIEETGAA